MFLFALDPYLDVPVSRLLVFASTKENGKDTLVYFTKLIDSDIGAKADPSPFLLPSHLIASKIRKGTSYWIPESISVDDKQVTLTMYHGHSYRPLYIAEITRTDTKPPELVTLPGVTEKVEETSYSSPRFSRDPAQAHVLYLITNAYGDSASVVAYDTLAGTVIHITTPEIDLCPLRPIPWETQGLLVTPSALFFRANAEGWQIMYAVPLSGAHAHEVREVHMRDWEGSPVAYVTNVRNGRPDQLVVHFNSFRMNSFLAPLDFSRVFEEKQLQNVFKHSQQNINKCNEVVEKWDLIKFWQSNLGRRLGRRLGFFLFLAWPRGGLRILNISTRPRTKN